MRERRPGAKSGRPTAVEHIDSYLSACQLGITLVLAGPRRPGRARIPRRCSSRCSGTARGWRGRGWPGDRVPAHHDAARGARRARAQERGDRADRRRWCWSSRPRCACSTSRRGRWWSCFNGHRRPRAQARSASRPRPRRGGQPHSEDELRMLLRESSRGGWIEAARSRSSRRPRWGSATARAREAMKPRAEVAGVTTDRHAVRVGRARHRGPATPGCRCARPRAGSRRRWGVINAKDLLPCRDRPTASPT